MNIRKIRHHHANQIPTATLMTSARTRKIKLKANNQNTTKSKQHLRIQRER
jgi:hypothetical protein